MWCVIRVELMSTAITGRCRTDMRIDAVRSRVFTASLLNQTRACHAEVAARLQEANEIVEIQITRSVVRERIDADHGVEELRRVR